MKFVVKNISGKNVINLMREIGYHFRGTDQERTELTFTHSLGPNSYPRFHIYLKENNKTGEIIINLHLDQKRPIYQGAPAHAGEYEGKAVETEAAIIKQILQPNAKN